MTKRTFLRNLFFGLGAALLGARRHKKALDKYEDPKKLDPKWEDAEIRTVYPDPNAPFQQVLKWGEPVKYASNKEWLKMHGIPVTPDTVAALRRVESLLDSHPRNTLL